jgi:hypothetical protein
MAILKEYNAFKLAEEVLTQNLKAEIEEGIMRNLIVEFKRKARPVIKEEVEKLTLGYIERGADYYQMREEVKVYFEWNDKGEDDV